MGKKRMLFLCFVCLLLVGCAALHRHRWQGADCVTPKTCARCGETEGEPLGHDWRDADCVTAKTCARCGEIEGEPLGHDWRAADCDSPKTCVRCGATEGEPLGHDWRAAACDSPKTCARCGATEGEPLGHDWRAADCDSPKTCARCGETEGEPLGHDWRDADCVTAKTCVRCGATEGEPLGHEPAPAVWENVKRPTCLEPGEHEAAAYCARCGIELSRETVADPPLGHAPLNGVCQRCGFGSYAPIRGRGNGTVADVPTWNEGVYRAHVTYRGDWTFVLWAFDAQDRGEMLSSSVGSYEGAALLLGEGPYTFEVEANDDWTIEIEKLQAVDASAFSGKGDSVTDMAPLPGGSYRLTHDGKSNFVVWAYTTAGEQLLLNRLGAVNETVEVDVPAGSLLFFAVRADGNWTIEGAQNP